MTADNVNRNVSEEWKRFDCIKPDVENLKATSLMSGLRVAQAVFKMDDGTPKLEQFTLVDPSLSQDSRQ